MPTANIIITVKETDDMFANERRKLMVDLINTKGSVRITDLAEEFNVTPETIRKDIHYLSQCGLVEKQFGGATALMNSPEITVEKRLEKNIDYKTRIAQKATEYVSGNILFLDAGSTLTAFAKVLPTTPEQAIVTNSFKAVDVLMNSLSTILFIGGEVSATTAATSGFWTSNTISALKIDIAFLGTSGFHSHAGPCAKSFSDAKTKMDIIRNSASKIVLADGSKFVTRAIVPYCDWDDIDILITDETAPKEQLAELEKHVKIIIA